MTEIKEGDFVKIINQETIAEVLSVRGNEVEIGVGGIKIRIKKSKIEIVKKPVVKDSLQGSGSYGVDTKDKLLNFKPELDVRGKAKEEVITELSAWIDDALLLGIKEAIVIHGRGSGILRETVRTFLKKYKEVVSLEDDYEGKGANFVTVVKLRV